MGSSAKVVVIGAGVVGASTAYHLAELDWTDVLVIDKGPLFATGGSSSHAPGLVFQTNASRTMTQLARYTVELYNSLELDGQACFHQVGGIEVAATPERWHDLKRKHGLATSWGLESALISPEEVARQVPLIDTERILGGFHVPTDGIAKSTRGVEAMSRTAQAKGVSFQADTEVTGFDIAQGRIRAVETTQGRIDAEFVLICCGIWGPKLGRLAGVSIPVLPLGHQYARTTPVPGLAGATEEVTHPLLRHQDHAMYFRQLYDTYGIGSYAHRAMPISAEDIPSIAESRARHRAGAPEEGGHWDGMPSALDFTEEDFKQAWAEATELLPPLAETELADAMNGLFLFTSDGNPVLGPSRQVQGLWVAEAVWVTHSGGVGKVMAEWLVEGRSSIDLRACDMHRFDEYQHSPHYVAERSEQNFREVYDIIHPLQPMEEPRPLRTAPFFQREQELGAYFLEASGWERPHWYESNRDLLAGRDIPGRDAWAARYWSPIVGAEAQVTRERVAMYDMGTLKRARVSGRGALGLLQQLTTNQLDRKPGYVTYTLMLDHQAGILSDVTVARLDQTTFQLGLNGQRDIDWLRQHAPADVHISDITGATTCIGLWGPRARDVLSGLTHDDVSHAGFGFFRSREIYVREVPVTALRLSYVGELGWELYTSAEYGLRLWDLLWQEGAQHGIIAGGRGAFNSLRIEKGYRSWGTDMWSEHTPAAAGLDFAVKTDKGDFIGRDALSRESEPAHRLTCLTLEDATRIALGNEPVYHGDQPVGFVTSAAHGYTTGQSIAYAWLPTEVAGHSPNLTVEYFGERLPARVAPDPIFDPQMKRMRA